MSHGGVSVAVSTAVSVSEPPVPVNSKQSPHISCKLLLVIEPMTDYSAACLYFVLTEIDKFLFTTGCQSVSALTAPRRMTD